MSEERLKIAHFVIGRCNPDSANGIDKTIYHLSRSQAGFGHDVAVYSLTDKPPLPVPGVRVKTFDPRLSSGGSIADRLAGYARLSVPDDLVADLASWKPDMLHLHFVYVPQNVALAHHMQRVEVPYCVTIHGGLAPSCQRRNRVRKLLFKVVAERRYLRDAAFLHAISDQDVEGLKTYGVTNRVPVIPNGMDLASVPASADGARLFQRFPGLVGKRVFLFLGRLDPGQKGLDLLVRAFAASRPEGAALVLVGPDWRGNLASLQRLAERSDVAADVVFAGPAFGADKYDFIAGADVFVHPSRWEAGVPFSVMEAAAMRKPCLFTPYADASGIMARYGAGIGVDADIPGIAGGITKFMAADAAALARMGANGRRMVEEQFDWQRIAARVVDEYRISFGTQ